MILLIDEAQLLWNEEKSGSSGFWTSVKGIQRGGKKVYIILAAAYGARRSGSSGTSTSGRSFPDSDLSTPVGIEKKGRTISVHRAADGIGLAFTLQEWAEVCCRFEQANPYLKFQPLVKSYIYESCKGQVRETMLLRGLLLCG